MVKVTQKLSDTILLTVCGVLSGQDTWEGIVDFGEMRRDFLNHYGDFSAGIPSQGNRMNILDFKGLS